MYTVVDLFAGAGGLSSGFMQTGEYDIKVAFENSPYMQDTYRTNHPNVDVRGDVCRANFDEIKAEYGPIDVVIGGPPCQGFSNANRQKSHAISQNNMLVKQYIRAIIELQPKAFVMENVSMLRSDVHRFYLDENDKDIVDKYSIPMRITPLKLLDSKYGFPGLEGLVLSPSRISECIWPEDQYVLLNVIYKAAKNEKKLKAALEKHKKKLLQYSDRQKSSVNLTTISKSSLHAFSAVSDYFDDSVRMPIKDIMQAIEPAIMYQRMLNKVKEIYDNHLIVERWEFDGVTAYIKSYAVFDYLQAVLKSSPNDYCIKSDVLCAADFGAPQKRMRFILMGVKKSICNEFELPSGKFKPENYRTVQDAIQDLEDIEPLSDTKDDVGIHLERKNDLSTLAESLRDAHVLKNHIVTKTTDTAMKRFKALKQGQNFHALDESMKSNTYTDASRTQNTIYLRLDYKKPCGTVVNVRKSMWIHPTKDRAISVREAARLQTFPDSFIFCGSKDKQYQQVGNAVPPIMAKAIAQELLLLLRNAERSYEK